MAGFVIRPGYAPAAGDIRAAKPGDVILLRPGAEQRADWPRLLDAIAAAISRGADVRWVAHRD